MKTNKTCKPVILFLIALMLFASCEENNDLIDDDINGKVIINEEFYSKSTSGNYTINNVTLNGDLLTINISSSGCNGVSWKTTLVDSGIYLQTVPLQGSLKLVLENNEMCAAYITEDFTFNISSLRTEIGTIYGIEGWNETIELKK